jgi:hypothetical protein
MSCQKVSLLLISLCLILFSAPARVTAQSASGQTSADAVVATYYQILNAGLNGADFSALASVFAPDATLTNSTTLGATIEVHGLNALIAFYRNIALRFPGMQFIRDRTYYLSPTIVLNYEHAPVPSLRVPGRCSHLFVLRNGRIEQLFWVVYSTARR